MVISPRELAFILPTFGGRGLLFSQFRLGRDLVSWSEFQLEDLESQLPNWISSYANQEIAFSSEACARTDKA